MVFETTAYADSAIKPTSLLDHTKGDPKRVLLWLPVSTLGHDGSINTPFCRKAIRRIPNISDGITMRDTPDPVSLTPDPSHHSIQHASSWKMGN